jgi:serine/threonine protein kinase
MGIAKQFNANDQMTLLGCTHYMPPEFFSGQYCKKLDIFTFGLTINELYNGKHQTEKAGRTPRQNITARAPVLYDFIEMCISSDQHRRPSADQAKSYLKDIFKRFDSHVNDEYKKLTNQGKNEIFKKFYRDKRGG